ncbi:MAG: ABC transporter permease subunit [Streptosporangiales bacterium]|nr:ABC transporter permease subunit [Streptosporangiales bacterium]MBO0890777.1 ABC transporter permease subunit [Acidothermales bacterium]
MPELPRIPVGKVIADVISWLTTHWSVFFDGISSILVAFGNAIYYVLSLPHPYVLTLIFAALALLVTRRPGLPIFTVIAFLLIDSMQLWDAMLNTLAIVVAAALIAIVIGIPLGIWAARSTSVSVTVRPVLDFMQTLPVFVYLLPAVFFFGIGIAPGIVATIVFAVPPAVRLTELGIRQVDREVVEAARAFGARPMQVLREVQLPLAMPTIMAGVNQVIMLALSMVVVAGLVGAPGLAQAVVASTQSLNVAGGFEGGIAVVILAVYLDRLTGGLGERRRRRGRKRRGRRAGQVPPEEAEVERENTRQPVAPVA